MLARDGGGAWVVSCAIVSCKVVSALCGVAAVGVFVVNVCSFVFVVVFMYLCRVAYVWTRGWAWLQDQERRDARPSWRTRCLCSCVRARLCENVVDCGASGFARVCALCHVACSCVALRLESYALHVSRICLCRALVSVARLFKNVSVA